MSKRFTEGIDKEMNMPIVRTEINEREWLDVDSNGALAKILNNK